MFEVEYKGLTKRETYDEIVNYLQNEQEKIKYPNRKAKQLRESPYLTNLLDVDGDGLLEMEEQQNNAMKNKEVEHMIRSQADKGKLTAHNLRSEIRKKPEQYDMSSDNEKT